jgi:pyruvate dehydrogenase (quinone)
MLGLIGITLDDPDRVGWTWDQALAAQRPVVIEAHTDPEVPTLPPHITFEQAKNFLSSITSDPNAAAMFRGTMTDALRGLFRKRSTRAESG